MAGRDSDGRLGRAGLSGTARWDGRLARRSVLLVSAASLVSACVTTGSETAETSPSGRMPPDRTASPDRPTQLIYIGAYDCAPCRTWEATIEPSFLASPTRARITYRKLKFPMFMDIAATSIWPEDLRWVRDRLQLRRGTPRWILVRGEEILLSTTRWRDVQPALERHLAA